MTVPALLLAVTVMLDGSDNTGGAVSTTVTVKLPVVVLLCASVAEQFTVVVPTGNASPDAGEQFTETVPSKRSEAEAS